MSAKFMSPFIMSAHEVLAKEVGAQVERGLLALDKTALTVDEVSVLVGISGQVEGTVVYGMSISTAQAIVGQMLGWPVTTFDKLGHSAIGELCSIISGQSCTRLEEEGYLSYPTPPTLIMGEGIRITTLAIQRLVIPILTQFGPLNVRLALRENLWDRAPKWGRSDR